MSVHAGDVGADQAVGDRGGRRELAQLAAYGLITVSDRERARGLWTVYVRDPREVGRPVHVGRGQAELFDDQVVGELNPASPPQLDVACGAADHVHDPPRAPSPSLNAARATRPSPSTREGEGAHDSWPRGGSCTASAAELVERVLSRGPDEREYLAAVERIVARIDAGVAGVDGSAARKVAHAVVEGVVSLRELDGLLDYVARLVAGGGNRAPAAGVFVSTAKKVFARRGLSWR